MHSTPNKRAKNRQEGQGHKRVSGGEFATALLRVEKAFEYETDYEILRTWEWIRTMSPTTAPEKTTGSVPEQSFTRH
jgi:hypothetical protein